MAKEVVYLGHKISEEGVQPLAEKIRAIEEMERPNNKKELQSYLGLINYYAKFLQNISTVLAPLYELLKKGAQFQWKEKEETAWLTSKKLLVESDILVHFDQEKELILACDASPYGIGSVLSHKMEDGSERPIAFASRTLTNSEKNYGQVEKEGLAVVFGVKKFHQYLYAGKPFQIVTDHKPLLGLFKETKGTPTLASARIQRWSLLLGAYNYTLKHRPGACIGHADGLSRFPLPDKTVDPPVPGETVLLMELLETMPVTARDISRWTTKDIELSKVKYFVQHGWPEKNNDESLKPYWSRQAELSVVDGCLLWGTRVIVPSKGRKALLEELHQGHSGMTKMKSVSRSYIWWPNIDKDIEHTVKMCDSCQVNSADPRRAPLHPWEWPGKPWSRIHIDYAGPFMGKMFLIVVDAYSKWMDVYPTSISTSTMTIELMRQSFAIHGLPDIVVSDNGTCFTSEEFGEFMRRNGIRHIRSAPYHPSTNGLAERAVQTFKMGMKKQKHGSIQTKVSRFLFEYRTRSHATTGQTPAEMMFRRKPKTRLDLVMPDIGMKVSKKQFDQQVNRPCRERSDFAEGDAVYVRNYSNQGKKWLKGHVLEKSGPLSYNVSLSENRVMKRHVDQMKGCENESEKVSEMGNSVVSVEENGVNAPYIESNSPVREESVIPESREKEKENSDSSSTSESAAESSLIATTPRPQRQRRMPERFKDFVT